MTTRASMTSGRFFVGSLASASMAPARLYESRVKVLAHATQPAGMLDTPRNVWHAVMRNTAYYAALATDGERPAVVRRGTPRSEAQGCRPRRAGWG